MGPVAMRGISFGLAGRTDGLKTMWPGTHHLGKYASRRLKPRSCAKCIVWDGRFHPEFATSQRSSRVSCCALPRPRMGNWNAAPYIQPPWKKGTPPPTYTHLDVARQAFCGRRV